MQQPELIPHLFRTEYSKIVAVLCRRFGFEHIELAEDIASDTFLAATQSWPFNGVPTNPIAWLYSVAKNKAKNHLQRQYIMDTKVAAEIGKTSVDYNEPGIDLSPQNISDSQLQMMFAICNPLIAPEAQIGLSLRILCGFGIDEIADAFLTNKETINKRLYRAKQKLRAHKVKLSSPNAPQINERLENVLTTIYLLFNEGYYSVSANQTINKELCLEAMRLCHILTDNKQTDLPQVNALLALMYFHTSRFEARTDQRGELILYDDQDTDLWDYELISKGGYYLNRSTGGATLSSYHLQATIAYWNTQKTDTVKKWENILHLYNLLLQVAYSPVAALNRTFALSKVYGKTVAIAEAEKLKLTNNHFYFMLLAHLYTDINKQQAYRNLEIALSMAVTAADQSTIRKMVAKITTGFISKS